MPAPINSDPATAATSGKPATGGTLSESDQSDNDPAALEVDSDRPSTSNDKVFDFAEFKDEPDTRTERPTKRRQLDDELPPLKKSTTGRIKTSIAQPISDEKTEEAAETEDTADTVEETAEEKPAAKEDKRDYSPFNAEDQEYLKKLPNSVFNHVAPILLKRYEIETTAKELEAEVKKYRDNPNRLPDAWYEHENAFTLTPEYQTLSGNYSRADYEANHWRQQLLNIENGAKTWHELEFVNNQYRLGREIQANPGDKVAISDAYNDAVRLKTKFADDADKLSKEFKVNHKNTIDFYKLPQVNKPFDDLLPELKPVKDIVDKFTKLFPEAHQKHPALNLAARMFSVVINQGKMIAKLQGKKAVVVGNKNDEVAAGPKNKSAIAIHGKSAKTSGEIDFDDLKTEMEGNS